MKNTYRVLIVEMKSQMVHIYKNMLKWEDYGFHIASITDNEDKALAYYGEYKYELIFTAIDLKAGNGISLIRQIKHLNPHSHIVVISAHDDYDTVKEAFKAGCNDYLLKSRIRYSSLAEILKEVKNSLDHDKSFAHNENWASTLENLLGLYRDQQKIDEQSMIELLRIGDLELIEENYQIFYFRMDNVRIFNRTMKQYDKPSWMSAEEFITMFQNKLLLRDEMQIKLKEIIEHDFQSYPEMRLLFTKKHSGLILLPVIDIEQSKVLARQLIQHINRMLTYEFSVSISSITCGLDNFLPAYKQIMDYHQHKFYDGDSCVECMEEQKQFHEIDALSLSYHNQIVDAFENQHYELPLPISDKAIQYMKDHMIYPDQVKSYFCMMIDKIEAMIKDKEISEQYPFEVLRQGIQETESIMYLSLEFEKIIKTLLDWVKENSVNNYKRQVNQIIQFINDHLDQKITLARISQFVGLSEIHTSRTFKKETKKSVIEYVNEVKMKKAAEMLKSNHVKIKDIAKAVGMEDQLYFNKVFKKHYEVSPREYRKNNQ